MQEAHEFLDAAMLTASAPEEAFQRFDVLAARHVEALRQLTKSVQDARLARDTEALKTAVIAYEEALEAYIPGELYSAIVSLWVACGSHSNVLTQSAWVWRLVVISLLWHPHEL